MDKKTETELEGLYGYIEEKQEEYKDVKGMEGFLTFLMETKTNVWLRAQCDEVYVDWLKAVRTDIKRMERWNKAEAGLLPPEEAEARQRLRDFLNSPCDLPPEVDIKIDIDKLNAKRKRSSNGGK